MRLQKHQKPSKLQIQQKKFFFLFLSIFSHFQKIFYEFCSTEKLFLTPSSIVKNFFQNKENNFKSFLLTQTFGTLQFHQSHIITFHQFFSHFQKFFCEFCSTEKLFSTLSSIVKNLFQDYKNSFESFL